MSKKEKRVLTVTVVFTIIAALSLAISAATFSVTGLSKTFAGSSQSIIIMGASLEFAKIVCAVYIHFFWNRMRTWMKGWLSLSLIILVILTSMGIYGFLSSSFKETETKYNASNTEIKFIEFEKEGFEQKITQLEETISQNNVQIENKDDLRENLVNALNGISSDFEYIDRKTGEKVRYRNRDASTERQNLIEESNLVKQELAELRSDNDKARDSIGVLRDSILSKDKLILQTELENDAAGELGPLIYISEVTGASMSKVVNYFILILVSVFDPLAILLVFAAIDAVKRQDAPQSTKTPEPTQHSSNPEKTFVKPSVSLTPQDYRGIVDKYHEKTTRSGKKFSKPKKNTKSIKPVKKNKLTPKKKS